jgi:cytidine deaminase
MEFRKLNEEDRELVERTMLLIRKRHSDISEVSAAVRTSRGSEFFGLSVDARTSTVGMCAEFSAIGSMLTDGESNIRTMVAISYSGKGRYRILPPCGKCRDLAREFGDPYVILQKGKSFGEPRKVRLSELIPAPWNEYSL